LLTPDRKKAEREKAAAGMQNFNAEKKRKRKDDQQACEKATRQRRQHPAARVNAVRKEAYNKEKDTVDELVRYWNEEKKEHLFVSPWGKHFRSGNGCLERREEGALVRKSLGNGCYVYDHMKEVTLQEDASSFLEVRTLADGCCSYCGNRMVHVEGSNSHRKNSVCGCDKVSRDKVSRKKHVASQNV
jgi:hypothetical protein